MSGALPTVDFTVDDSSQPPLLRPLAGRVRNGLNVGAQIGFDRRITRHLVVGGEAGLQHLGYHGAVRIGLGGGTLAETSGGLSWTAQARVGYIAKSIMPYLAVGFVDLRNTVRIVDACESVPCGPSGGETSDTTSAMRMILVLGTDLPIGRANGRAWTLRVEWMHMDSDAVLNTFARDVGMSLGPAWPVEFRTEIPSGLLRALVSFRINRR